MPSTFTERFWSKVERGGASECWQWRGSIDTRGYGSTNMDGVTSRAHRVSYELSNGPIPKGVGHHGVCVLHTCDNRACVNPTHLFLGTHKDNMGDMVAKGRKPSRVGSRNGRAILSEAQVIAIRSDARVAPAIAKDYSVGRWVVHSIKRGRTWATATN